MSNTEPQLRPQWTRPDAQPVAVTMWDFSWLLRRDGDEAEYSDVDQVLDELAERGYDTVRIDAFPHWIAKGRQGRAENVVTAEPQGSTFMWGNHHRVQVRPRPALASFLDGLRRRGLRVALSTWLTQDSTGRAEQIRTPDDLARVWIETLDYIDELGHLDLIDYVDLANEWPLFTQGPQHEIWPEGIPADIWQGQAWTTDEVARIDRFTAALETVKARFPELPVLFSYCLRGATLPAADDCMRLSSKGFDLAEVHLWLTSTPEFVQATAFPNGSGGWDELREHQRLVNALYWSNRDRWLADLGVLMTRWKGWADQRSLPIWTTECWASVFWNPDLMTASTNGGDQWSYVRDVADFAVPLAKRLGWSGISTSNFSQPHHRELWADRAWHQRLTDLIHS